MTVIGSRIGMRHTCDIERASGADDSWGQPGTTWTIAHASVVCHVWTSSETLINENDAVMTLAVRYIVFPLGTDISNVDRIGDIKLRGQLLWPGPHYLDEVAILPDRLEATLRTEV